MWIAGRHTRVASRDEDRERQVSSLGLNSGLEAGNPGSISSFSCASDPSKSPPTQCVDQPCKKRFTYTVHVHIT